MSNDTRPSAGIKTEDNIMIRINPKFQLNGFSNNSVLEEDTENEHCFVCEKCNRVFKSHFRLGPLFPSPAAAMVYNLSATFHATSNAAAVAAVAAVTSAGNNKPFACRRCGKEYESRNGVYKHEKYECVYGEWIDPVQLKPKKYFCKNCKKPYESHNGVYKHERYECGREPNFRCTLCPFKTYYLFNLKAHYSRRHQDSNCYFLDPSLYRMVSKPSSGQEERNQIYPCDTCNKVYRSRTGRYVHKKYECDTIYEIPDRSYTEIVTMSGGLFCGLCGKAFGKPRSLYAHERFECGQLPKHCCKFCGYRTHRISNIKRHIERHHSKNNNKK
ncbi:zinc finger protein 667-like [Ctenocephalides felis]|uniref:zinc finger protein 667-like n=1 Tax=Ctenocephalides felis TaxID=7515 RepID=UPI000E6E3947|nr:zinc finger protein 667-like [Ctenocephalides felis]